MISIIIPVFNEASVIIATITRIRAHCASDDVEIIVVDGGSSDHTSVEAKKTGATVVSSKKGRAKQMNFGASVANGEIFYFLHADSIPPRNFDQTILNAYRTGVKSGSFKLHFDHEHWFLKANSWLTRFDVNAVRFGDQSLFVEDEVFKKSGGFREDLIVMEDQEIIHRLKRYGKFMVLNDVVITSARKYVDNGIFRMQGIFVRIWTLYYLGYPQDKIVQVYKKLINKHKL